MNTKGAKLRLFLEFAIFAIYSVTTGESRINIDSGSELCSIAEKQGNQDAVDGLLNSFSFYSYSVSLQHLHISRI